MAEEKLFNQVLYNPIHVLRHILPRLHQARITISDHVNMTKNCQEKRLIRLLFSDLY